MSGGYLKVYRAPNGMWTWKVVDAFGGRMDGAGAYHWETEDGARKNAAKHGWTVR